MLKHNGTKTIETERFILRQFTIDDAEDMFKNWANDDEVTKYLIWSPHGNIVQATHDVDNPASGKVMIKSGMKYEGRLRKYNKNNQGTFVDCDIYAILDEDIKKTV